MQPSKLTPYARKFVSVWWDVQSKKSGRLAHVAQRMGIKKVDTARAFAYQLRRKGHDLPTFKTGPKVKNRTKR